MCACFGKEILHVHEFFAADKDNGFSHFWVQVLQTIDFNVTNVHYLMTELDSHDPNSAALQSLILASGFIRSEINMKEGCLQGGDCADNLLFVNPLFEQRRRGNMPLYQMGTGMRC